MRILRRRSSCKTLIELDEKDLSRRDYLPIQGNDPVINGYFEIMGEEFVSIYESMGHLLISMDGISVKLNQISGVSLTINRENNKMEIVSVQGGISISYRPDARSKFERDPTPFVEDEHFDFGLFIKNIFEDFPRRERLLSVWR